MMDEDAYLGIEPAQASAPTVHGAECEQRIPGVYECACVHSGGAKAEVPAQGTTWCNCSPIHQPGCMADAAPTPQPETLKALEAELPAGFDIGDDATAELAIKCNELRTVNQEMLTALRTAAPYLSYATPGRHVVLAAIAKAEALNGR